MAKDWQVRKRRPVRKKLIAPLLADLETGLGINLSLTGSFLEMAEYGNWKLVIVNKEPHAIELEDSEGKRCVFLTLKGLMAHKPNLKWIEVDIGAIPFLVKGADCMMAGIHSTDENIKSGDLVWIRDQEHTRPLAIGWALLDSKQLIKETKGKGVNTIHWVGDELWEMEF